MCAFRQSYLMRSTDGVQRPKRPEVWLRGPVPGISPDLQAVAHALLQAREDVEGLLGESDPEELWRDPGGAATLGFHLRHMAGSLERLLAYARGEPLSEAQRVALAAEKSPSPSVTVVELLSSFRNAVDEALEQLRSTPSAELDEPRGVGRAGIPSTVRGLLAHAGEHTARHAGQIATTVRILEGG